ncbi:hypothetical protein HA402_006014 [Bradysia odoriphaga]|nr:hypothetical protein HA402_006014 [Bradysia odoriphaga]
MDCGNIERFNNIGKSQQDNRDYRGLKLANGLKVLLVSDPVTDKSSAALTVDVGHMKNGGSSNASTYADNTKYYFDIVPSQLEGALDRFAQFFISPLFTETATEREINAVDSEHDKNVAIDVWRIRQVSKSLADPNHPYSKFGTGNKKTLFEDPLARGINVRDELIKFHDRWYSANIMSLAVYGKETLDELETMVVSKFSGIVNKNVEAPRWNDAPFLADQEATKVSIVPVKDSRSLTISFPTGDLEKHYKSSPEQYLSHLLGHEGKGSILSELKSKGWCNSLMAGHSTSARGFGFFDISVDLSKEGFENVDEIIKIIFQYINMLKANEPKKWIFEEYCNLSEMQFRFKDKDTPLSLVSGVVHSMQLYPLEEVLTAPYLVSEWRPDLIEDLQKDLTPTTCRIIVVGQKLESIANNAEKWYGTKYHWEKLDKKLLEEWLNCGFNPKLSFPNANPFIPTDFNLYPIEADVQKIPIIIHDTPVMRVWYKQDTEFLKPKAIMNFDFSSPLAYADPLNCDLTHMFVHLFKDELNEYLYEADLAGLRMGVSNTANGISLSVSGYSDKQQVLLAKILDQMFNFEFDEKRFEIIKEQLMRALKNFKAEQPYQHAVYFLALLLTEHAWTKQELIDAVALITIERLQQYIKDFLSRMHVECFIHGNVNKQKALDLAGLVEKKLDSTHANVLPLLSRQLMLKREYKLVTGERYLFETENEFHKSSCASVYLQCGPQDDRSNVFIDLVTQILSEPCYNQLRTKEQLGYIVFCGARKANGVHGIRFIVQSAKHPVFVEERIKVFLDSMVEQLTNMTDDEFERHKEALAAQKLEKPKRLSTQFNKFLNEISLQLYHFERAEKEVVILRTVTKAELIEYYENFILFSGPRNCALSIHIVSTAEGGIGHSDVTEEKPARPDMVVISDLAAFKSSKELYAVAQPYINIQPKGGKSKL